MAIVRGTIKAKSNKFAPKESIVLAENDGVWYSSKFGIKADKGDVVEFDDGGGKMVKSLRIIDSGGGASEAPTGAGNYTRSNAQPGFPVATNTKDRSIVRQNAVTSATRLLTSMLDNGLLNIDNSEEDDEKNIRAVLSYVEDMARFIESYTAGDGDAEEVRKMMEQNNAE